jgi:Iron only hydrogenase large subunit, C-terminal domain
MRNSDMRELTLLVPLQSLRRASCLQQSLVSLASNSRLDLAASGASIDSDSENDEIPLVFAAAYGFRNIQGVVSRLRRSAISAGSRTPPFAFVEVMACPSGCVNGGGLPRSNAISHYADEKGTKGVATSYSTTADRIRDVSSFVHDKAGRGEDISPPSDPRTTVARLLRAVPLLRELAEGDSKAGLAWLLRTRFHALPRTEGLGVRW